MRIYCMFLEMIELFTLTQILIGNVNSHNIIEVDIDLTRFSIGMISSRIKGALAQAMPGICHTWMFQYRRAQEAQETAFTAKGHFPSGILDKAGEVGGD